MKIKNALQLIAVIVSITFIIVTKFATPPAGLSQSGFMVLGILVSAMFLWLLVNLEWTCLFIIFALMTVPELGVTKVAALSFGSKAIIFFVSMFILASSLVTTGVAKRVAVRCMTNKLSRKSPWLNVFMIFAGALILAQGLASPAILVIYFPILYEIFDMVHFEKGEAAPAMMVFGSALVAQMAMGTTPICHSVAITGMALYNSFTGDTVSIASFYAIGLPIGLVMFTAIFLICRFIWKPDLSKLENIDHEIIKAKLGPMGADEKIAIITYLIVIAFWILPGLTDFIPGIDFMKNISNVYPPIIAIALLSLIKINEKPVLDYNRALKENVPWKIIIFSASIQVLGKSLSDKDIGFSDWAGKILTPIFENISPLIFIMILIGLTVILTNFISNSVSLALAFATGMPLMTTVYSGQINTMVMAILLIGAANYAFATPPATHAIALTAATGWVDVKTILKYGSITTIAGILIYYIIGIPLGKLLFGI